MKFISLFMKSYLLLAIFFSSYAQITCANFVEHCTKNDSSFFTSGHSEIACNAIPVVIGLTWAFGSGVVEFVGASATCGVLGLLGFKLYKDRNKAVKAKVNIGSLASGPSPHGPDPDDDEKEDSSKVQIFEKNAKHIFRNKMNHLTDTPANRKLLTGVASDAKNFLGVDRHGNQWFAKILANGRQAWVTVRDNCIRDGGLNSVVRTFNNQTGLCRALGK